MMHDAWCLSSRPSFAPKAVESSVTSVPTNSRRLADEIAVHAVGRWTRYTCVRGGNG